jgi:PAS domain S-box-containing protein
MHVIVRKISIALILCLIPLGFAYGYSSGINFTAEEKDYLNSHDTVIFISQTHYPPFEFQNKEGDHDGMAIELIHWLATEIGFRAEFKDSSFLEAQKAILSGDADVLTSFFFSEKRDKSFDFTQPIFEVPASLFVVADRPDIARLQDLSGKRIAIQKGDYAKEFLESKGNDFVIFPTSNFAESMDAVIEGKADAIIGDEQIVLYHLYSHGLTDKVKRVGEPLYTGLDCLGLKEGNLVLRSILDKGITYARTSGVLERLNQKWLGTTFSTHANYWALFLPYLAALLGLSLIIAIWNIRLNKLIQKKTKHLHESEEKFRLAFKTSPDAINLNRLDDGVYVEINAGFTQISGYTADEAIGKSTLELNVWRDPEDRETLLRQLKEQGYAENFEAELVAKDGSIKSEIISARVLEVAGEKLILSVIRDVTKRKQAEKALVESKQRFRSMMEYIPSVAIQGYALDGTVLFWNRASELLYGYSKEEALGANLFDLIIPEEMKEGIAAEIQKMSESSVPIPAGELFLKRKDGSRVPILSSHALLSPKGGQPELFCLDIDLTESKQAEKLRLELESQLLQKHKMEAIGYMAGGIAHNFNNNLSIILGNVDLAQRLQPSGSEIIHFLENAKIAVRRSRDLVQKIITYSRKGSTHKVPIELTTIIDETLMLYHSTLPTSVTLQKDFDPASETLMINADASQIQEVLINLLNNAVQAMDEKGELNILLEPIELEQKNIPAQYECLPGQYVKLSVQDSGCGIPAEILDKIFDPFYSTKEEHKGAGMGLSTVQGIVAQHGGFIKVNSVLGQGTIFDIYFQIIEQTHTGEPAAEDTILPRGTEHILFVDDDKMLASLGEKLLTEMGYQVSTMTDSTEALKMFAENADHFDLVITDQTMPNLTGKDLIEEIKKVKADILTILCTGYSSKIDKDHAKEQGINAFMMKPLDLLQLAQTVRKVLDGVDVG